VQPKIPSFVEICQVVSDMIHADSQVLSLLFTYLVQRLLKS